MYSETVFNFNKCKYTNFSRICKIVYMLTIAFSTCHLLTEMDYENMTY